MDNKEIERRERKLRRVVELLAQGHKVTALQINQYVVSSDARKMISVLRQKGYPIKDMIIDRTSRTKVYYLDFELAAKKRGCIGKQLNLFGDENR